MNDSGGWEPEYKRQIDLYKFLIGECSIMVSESLVAIREYCHHLGLRRLESIGIFE